MTSNIKTKTITHELNTVSEKKFLSKLADRDYKVKLTFKEGIYDDEAIVQGFQEDISAFIGFFKNMKSLNNQPKKTMTRSFPAC